MTPNTQSLIEALNCVTWYNGLAEIIEEWTKPKYFIEEYGHLNWDWKKFHKFDMETQAQIEVFWMICVSLFGEYGTSPRSGWIEDKEEFYKFCRDITKNWREYCELEKLREG